MPTPRRIIVLDRDGVINHDSDDYIKSPEEWRALPGSLAAIARLNAAGFEVVVTSNQSGIARGLFDLAQLERIHDKMRAQIGAAGGRLAGVYFCPHLPEAGCDCRKPRPGMLLEAQRELGLDSLAGIPVIGDQRVDLELADAVGGRGILVLTGKGRQTVTTHGAREVFPDLAAAVDALLAETRR